jgi:hypothetical protein
LDALPITVFLSRSGQIPPGVGGASAEVIAETQGPEEFMALGPGGALVHHVSAQRSYVRKIGPLPLAYEARVAERLLELETLWNRRIEGIVDLDGSGAVARRFWPNVAASAATQAPRAEWPPVKAVELVCCTYNRVSEPTAALSHLLDAAHHASAAGTHTTVNVVFQNEWFPDRLFEQRPDWRRDPLLRLTSSLPGLPRARNTAVASSAADLLVFVDDDVELDGEFVAGYVASANSHAAAIGLVGRIRSRTVGANRRNEALSVGQVRVSGWVDDNFDSLGRAGVTVVPQSPRGANMAFRRAPMSSLLGDRWFDETLTGSAHREETTLGVELFRRGHHLVFAPEASLLHLEAEQGGCENRGALTLQQRVAHSALDYLFLNRLYAPARALRGWAPLLTVAREVRHARGPREKLTAGWVNLRAFRDGRRLYLQRERERSG